jgi:surfactin synthase thioesterase subunit
MTNDAARGRPRDQALTKSPWLLHLVSDRFAARLFCFPYSGCGASMYRLWPRNIGPVEVCPIQLPARENRIREPHYGTYDRLADQLADALLPFLDRPYAFFGHCGAALPGFETTLRLVERGGPAPSHFFASAAVAPHEGPYGRFLQLSRPALAEELRLLMTTAGGRKPPQEVVDLYLEVLVADVDANKRYRKAEPVGLPCGITAIGWRHDTDVRPELMRGWQACGRTRFPVLDGEHYTFLAAPPALLAEIERDMTAALRQRDRT